MQGRELIDEDDPSSSSSSGWSFSVKAVLMTVAAAVLGTIVITCFAVFATRKAEAPERVLRDGIVETVKLTNKAALDKKEYQYAKFSNGLEVVSIQDANTVSSGFSVAVEAGSFSDKDTLPGLAHFCENMLFLGTEKYPNATGFNDYLQMHGGSHNAYTAPEATVYYAQLDNAGFEGGLDRFADLFRAPLFDKQHVQKEVQAIDSEHAKNKQSSQKRIKRIVHSLADPRSAVSSFPTGNLETLYTKPQSEGVDTVDELKKYYKANYCPPRMKLVTFGQGSTEDQINTAYDKFHDLVSPEGCSPEKPEFSQPTAYTTDKTRKFVHIKGVSPEAQLVMFVNLPPLGGNYKSKPAAYMEHIYGYGGEHSLQYALKEDLGLINGMSVSSEDTSAGTGFWITFDLTAKGRENHQIKVLLSTFYYYVQMVLKKGVDMQLYKSIAAAREQKWNQAEAAEITDTVMGTAETMTRIGKDDLLTGDDLITEYHPSELFSLLKWFRPTNTLFIFVDQEFDNRKFDASVPIQTDPYYEAQFKVMPINSAFPEPGDDDLADEWGDWVQYYKSGMADDPAYNRRTGLHLPTIVVPTAIKDTPTAFMKKN